MNILSVRNLKKYYNTGENTVKALDGVDLDICRGEFLAIVGTSGSGKSTLLHMLGGLDNPTSGEVIIDGKDMSGLSRDELTIYRRRKIGFVFQQFNLLPVLTAQENIVMPLLLAKEQPDLGYMTKIVKFLGIEDRMIHLPNELSGGQQQRVAIARALIAKPDIIFADEPTGNLDSKSGCEVMKILRSLWSEMGKTLVIITHDPHVAEMAERQFMIVDGKIAEVGK